MRNLRLFPESNAGRRISFDYIVDYWSNLPIAAASTVMKRGTHHQAHNAQTMRAGRIGRSQFGHIGQAAAEPS